MVFPLYDDNSDRTITPWVNYAIIGLNIFVFVFLQQLGSNDQFTYSFSTVPREILTGHDVVTSAHRVVDPVSGQVLTIPGLGPTPISVYITLFTSMFMHGGIAHIAGNMLFLWIFGDNIEDRVGHVKYVIFYLLCGVLASLSHVFATGVFATDEQEPPGSESRCFGRNLWSVGCLHSALSETARDGDSLPFSHASPSVRRDRDLVRVSVDQRTRHARQRLTGRWCGLCGARRRIPGWVDTDQVF